MNENYYSTLEREHAEHARRGNDNPMLGRVIKAATAPDAPLANFLILRMDFDNSQRLHYDGLIVGDLRQGTQPLSMVAYRIAPRERFLRTTNKAASKLTNRTATTLTKSRFLEIDKRWRQAGARVSTKAYEDAMNEDLWESPAPSPAQPGTTFSGSSQLLPEFLKKPKAP